jgi:hypothetical protein
MHTPPLDSAAYTCMLVSYQRLSLLFQFSVSAVTIVYLSQWGRGRGGGQREGTVDSVEGQQYTSIFPSSMGATVHKVDRK